MVSPQTLSESDRRLLALWAAECAGRVLPFFHPKSADDHRVPDALARAQAFAEGASTAAAEIKLRLVAFSAAGLATDAAGAAAGRSVAQAAAVAHMGAHALGAAAYAVKALTLALPDEPDAGAAELQWQLGQLSNEQRRALRTLPLIGSDRAGPLGPGLLSKGLLGDVIQQIQSQVA